MGGDKANISIGSNKLLRQAVFGTGGIAVIALSAVLINLIATSGGLSEMTAAARAESYVNAELLGGQGGAAVTVVGSEGKLYRLSIAYQGKKIDSYMTKDGKKFFPQVFDMNGGTAAAGGAAASDGNQAPAPAAAVKSDKPVVELFVMSYCPYGTQIEKGIIPVIRQLGSKLDFKLKFVDYILHGEKENVENSRQFCIDKTQNSKLLPYLDCFVKSGDAAACQKSGGINENKVNSCMAETEKKYDISGKNFSVFKAENDKYGVQGSPTLVINGSTVQSGRDSASLLKTICSAFKTAPNECQAELPSVSPAPGFGQQ